MNIAIILAGGVGSRVGAEIPKQFIHVDHKPILAYTVEAFENHDEIDGIEIVCIDKYMDYMREIVDKYNFTKTKWIVKGGETFQDSVINGIKNLDGMAKENDIILIHYGASPFISKEIITDGIDVCKIKGNCTSATPCYLLLGSNDDCTKSTKWIDRDKVMQLNSPQCFKYGYIRQLYEEAIEKELLNKVESHTTSLMYYMGRTIYFSKGNQTNIKITTKEDLELFKAYVFMNKHMKNDSYL